MRNFIIKEINKDDIMKVAKVAAVPGETIHTMPFPADADTVYGASLAANPGRFYSDFKE